MIDGISIFVADMERSLAFYRALGLPIDPGADGQPHVEHVLAGGFRLMWDTHDTLASYDPGFGSVGAGNDAGRRGLELTFRCESADDVDARCSHLAEAGYHVHLAPFDAFWGQRYATVRDPDGNHVALYAALTDE